MAISPARLNDLFGATEAPVIMGPTASGKSELAMAVAEQFGGEIVCADSMQFYRGLDIGTAKATRTERDRVPHHLIDTLDITEKSDIYRFRAEAEHCIADIRARGKRPVIEGGSGLYLRALCSGLDDLPAKQGLRDELDARYDNAEHFEELRAVMRSKCPADYARFSEHRRKLIRAYEVFLLSGKEITELQKAGSGAPPRTDLSQFVLEWDRETLKQRIRERTKRMLAAGWIEEAEELISRGLLRTPTAWQALGYPVIADFLGGKIGHAELSDRIATATWQYARRQITWFKHQHPQAERIVMPL